jgi:hypothetical protein
MATLQKNRYYWFISFVMFAITVAFLQLVFYSVMLFASRSGIIDLNRNLKVLGETTVQPFNNCISNP